MPNLIGVTLGSYRIIEQIGLGGMATVYKAYQASTDRLVAVKVLPDHYSSDPNFVQRFKREARIIAKLEHPNIIPIYEYGEQNGVAYLVMRYLQAGTITDILTNGPLPLPDISKLLGDIASALDHAHSLGIIHRDVKPSNVLIDKQAHAYLTDFGIAKVLEGTGNLTGSGMLGTPAYMSPEQTLGKRVTAQSDIYSLGVMLYEMVTGKPPYEAETPMAVALMHIQEPLPLPRLVKPDLSEEIELVILKALAKEPNDRYKTAGELAQEFIKAVGSEAGSTPQRLIEFASIVATGKSETTEIREELRKRDEAEKRQRAFRFVLWAVGILGVISFLGATLFFTMQSANTAQLALTAIAQRAAQVFNQPVSSPPTPNPLTPIAILVTVVTTPTSSTSITFGGATSTPVGISLSYEGIQKPPYQYTDFSIPYKFCAKGFDISFMDPKRSDLDKVFENPARWGWGGSGTGSGNCFWIFMGESQPSGVYLVALNLPNGKRVEANFTHASAIVTQQPTASGTRSTAIGIALNYEGSVAPPYEYSAYTIPYKFCTKGFDRSFMDPRRPDIDTVFENPARGWGGSGTGPDHSCFWIFMGESQAAGTYRVALNLPDGRRVEAYFIHPPK